MYIQCVWCNNLRPACNNVEYPPLPSPLFSSSLDRYWEADMAPGVVLSTSPFVPGKPASKTRLMAWRARVQGVLDTRNKTLHEEALAMQKEAEKEEKEKEKRRKEASKAMETSGGLDSSGVAGHSFGAQGVRAGKVGGGCDREEEERDGSCQPRQPGYWDGSAVEGDTVEFSWSQR